MEAVPPKAPRWGAITSAIACGALLACLLPSAAAAFHVPGAAYSGAVSGGGSIGFSVSTDGSSITNLTLSGIHAGDCTLGSKQYPGPTPIANNSFNNGEVSGGFPNVQGAYGRLNILVPGLLSSCRITGTWSAITRADPAGSEECKAAQRQLGKKKRALTKARRGGNPAKIKKAQGKWRKARSKRDQVC
jgi:hypothetical protein